ncbi:hypothetical protein E4U54_000221 [Claviceps lovelessii]|nr:hypothetical protein E4U54_000221 [Claviceps lovelessii]
MSFPNPRRRTTPVDRFGKDSEGGSVLKTTMGLRKGATFHCPNSPISSTSDSVFVPPHLSWSRTHLDDVVDANRRRIALTLNDIDEVLARTESLGLSSPPPCKKTSLQDSSLAVPRGFLDLPVVVDSKMDKVNSLRRRRHSKHASDSGLGSSIGSSQETKKNEPAQTAQKKKNIKTNNKATSSLVAGPSNAKQLLPAMSRRAFSRIHEHTLRPLLAKPSLKEFEAIVLDVPRQIRSKEIICLRDLEKCLVFMAAPETAKSAALYLDFCLTSIRCIQATVEYLPEHEQIRSDDRPYTNGYFIDLKEQIYEYGRQLAAAKEKSGAANDMDVDKDDRIRLFGGIADNGRPAELVRVRKDGSAISIATGKPVNLEEAPVKFKRSLSEQRDDEEEIRRSMARRRKNATAEELAPKKCRHAGCEKEFKRPCDLTKHEKTHSRPWKCPVTSCPYHQTGWPTEKEMDRHTNDKHSDSPILHKCEKCAFASKRESNLKQHMERAHDTPYIRTKTNRNRGVGKSNPSRQQLLQSMQLQQQHTPPPDSISPPTMTPSFCSVPTPPKDQDGMVYTNYRGDGDLTLLAACGSGLDAVPLTLEHISPSSTASPYAQYHPYQDDANFIVSDEELYAAPMQLPSHLPTQNQMYHDKLMRLELPVCQAADASCAAPTTSSAPAPAPAYAPGPTTHFGISGQQNAMLWTPQSQCDEGFGDVLHGEGPDFALYPVGHYHKGNIDIQQASLFGDYDPPDANYGFSQTSQSDFFHQTALLASEVEPFLAE